MKEQWRVRLSNVSCLLSTGYNNGGAAKGQMSDGISVIVNGEPREIPSGVNVSAMLAHLGITSGRVAIERNFDILPRSQWDATEVSAGDRYEIVHLVGGG
jgi:thiamine biosynthesis protein ThiS